MHRLMSDEQLNFTVSLEDFPTSVPQLRLTFTQTGTDPRALNFTETHQNAVESLVEEWTSS